MDGDRELGRRLNESILKYGDGDQMWGRGKEIAGVKIEIGGVVSRTTLGWSRL